MDERFCIDEDEFRLIAVNREELEPIIEAFLLLVDRIRSENQQITRSCNLECTEVMSGVLLSDLMYSIDDLLSRDIRRLLIESLNRCTFWDDPKRKDFEKPRMKVAANSSGSLTLVYNRLCKPYGTCCLSPRTLSGSHGPQTVSGCDGDVTVHYVRDVETLLGFYRSLFELEDLDKGDYILHCRIAFPDLYLVPGLENQFSRFSESYESIRQKVTHHLSHLNDHFQSIFKEESHQPDQVCRRFSSEYSVDMSPESPNTRRNKRALKQREVDIEGVTIRCEWHTKISRDIDRIHFHPGNQGLAGGRVIIGIFASHLQT